MDDTEHTLSVRALIRALASLLPTDRVTANTVGNLLILRDGAKIGHINIRDWGEWDDSDPLELYENRPPS